VVIYGVCAGFAVGVLQTCNGTDVFLTLVIGFCWVVWFNTSNFPKTEVGSGETGAPVQTLENLEMKKTLVALAALAATSAFAQNAVSLYGTLDLGAHSAEYLKDGASQVKRVGYAQGGHDTSRWGLTGKEDLGGGLTAEFKIESQIGQHPRAGLGGTGITTAGAASVTDYNYANATPEKGNGYSLDATVLGNRELWLAVSNQSGTTAKFGFGVTALRSLAVETDAAGSNNYGNMIGHVVGGIRREGVRVDQAFGPLNVSVEAFGNSQQSQTEAVGDLRIAKGYTYAAQYKQGPWNAGFGYDQARSSTPALTGANMGNALVTADVAASKAVDVTVKTTLLAGSYDAGVAKLFAQTWQQEAINEGGAGSAYAQDGTGAGSGKWTGNSFGVRVPVGAFTPFAQMYSGKNKVYVVGGTAEDRKVTGSSFGVRYDLSKRTYTYLNTGSLKTDKGAASTANELKFKQTGAGLVHYF
jgi:predicted porin